MIKRIGVKMYKLILALIEYIARKWHYKSRVEYKIDAIINRQIDTERRVLRLEIIDAIKRDDRAVVHHLYDEYKAMNGNSYLNELYKDYCKKPTKRKKK